MQIFSGTVRLGGSRDNEVFIPDMSAAEVVLLRHLHGSDEGVAHLKLIGDEPRTDADERERLTLKYVTHVKSRATFEGVFGNAYQALPAALPEFPAQPAKAPRAKPAQAATGAAADFADLAA